MYNKMRAAVMAAACLSLAAAPVVAQTPAPEPAPAAPATAPEPAIPAAPAADAAPSIEATPTPEAAPAPEAVPSSATAPVDTAAAAPLVTFVKHTKPFSLVDTTAGTAAFGMAGAFASISMGKDIVNDNAVRDPSDDMALAIANAYAASKGGTAAPVDTLNYDQPWNKAKPADLAKMAGGARYIVDLGSSGNILYFSLDWTHYDVMFFSLVRIIDTQDGKVVAKAKCFLKTDKTKAQTHAALIDNGAVGLKKVLVEKSQTCVEQMKASLKI